MKNSILQKALKGQKTKRAPVWLMRQAGRYLEEYKALKKNYSFIELCSSSELALNISLQPIEILKVDAAIVFSDILLPLKGLGIEVDFNPGPIIKNPIKTTSDISNLSILPPNRHSLTTLEVIQELATTFSNTNKAVIGFSGAPWTLCYYLTKEKDFTSTLILAKKHKKSFLELMEKLSTLVTEYLLAQIAHGADVIQIFDTWAGVLSLKDYKEFVAPYNRKIISDIKKTKTPVILFTKNTSQLLPALIESEADCISVDFTSCLEDISSKIPDSIAIQGNFNPTDLFLEKKEIEKRTISMINTCKKRKYIANLGHGILPTTPKENVISFVNTVKNYKY